MRAHETTRRLADSVVTVADVATFDLIRFGDTEPANNAARVLTLAQLSIAPVAERSCCRYVTLTSLQNAGSEATVGDCAEPIPVEHVIAASTPLSDLIVELASYSHFFVLRGAWIDGIVTRADLQLPIVGMAVLGHIVTLEQALNRLLVHYCGSDWPSLLADRDQRQLELIYEDRKKHKVDIGMVECLNLAQRLNLVDRHERLRQDLGFDSRTKLKSFVRPTIVMRNVLAHGSGLLSSSHDPTSAIEHFEKLRELTQRAADLADGLDELRGHR